MKYIKTYEKIIYDKSVEDEEGFEVKDLTKFQIEELEKFPFKLGQYVLYRSDFHDVIYAKIIAINTKTLPTYKIKLIDNDNTKFVRMPITWANNSNLIELTPEEIEHVKDIEIAKKYNL